jgi:hypothetical protein
MSNTTLQQVYVDAFRDNVRQLAQQKGSKLRAWCDQFSSEAETGNWDRLTKGEAVTKPRLTATGDGTGRVWSRRIAVAAPWKDDEVTEVEDPSMMLIDPNSNLVTSLGYSMGRQMDRLVIQGAIGNALNSVRNGDGSNAPTNIALPAGQIVGDYSTPISFDMVTEAIQIFNTNDVPMDEPKVAIIGPQQIRELMNLTEQTSSDYVQAQALQQNGIVPNWMGFTWIMSTLLTSLVPAENEKDIIFMSRKGCGFHIPQDVTAFVERDPSINYAWRPYCQFTAAGVRVEDEHVVVGRVLDPTVPAP